MDLENTGEEESRDFEFFRGGERMYQNKKAVCRGSIEKSVLFIW